MTAATPPGKWIEGLAAGSPVSEAARRVLKVRLKGVEGLLPLAARKADDDVEYVHQLRVVTRRSDAALRIFEPYVDAREHRKARRRLKKLRRAAADARECDVQFAVLEADRHEAPDAVARALDSVLVQLQEQRRAAQKGIRAVARRYASGERLRRARRRLLRSLRAPRQAPEALLADAAAAAIPALVEALRSAAAADLANVLNLHALRIAGKRLRYALEVFAPRFGAGFQEAYAEIEALQEILGGINDRHDLVLRIEAWTAEAVGDEAGGGREAVEHYRRRREELIRSFLESWAGGSRARLFGALERMAPAPAAAAPAPLSAANGEPR